MTAPAARSIGVGKSLKGTVPALLSACCSVIYPIARSSIKGAAVVLVFVFVLLLSVHWEHTPPLCEDSASNYP